LEGVIQQLVTAWHIQHSNKKCL